MNNKIITALILASLSNITLCMETNWILDKIFEHNNPVKSAYICPSGQYLTTYANDTVLTFDTTTKNQLCNFNNGVPTDACCLSQFNNIILLSNPNTHSTVYFALNSDKEPNRFGNFKSQLPIAPHLFDSTQLVARSNANTVTIYDILNGCDTSSFDHVSQVNDCCLHPLKKILASITSLPDATVRIFDIATKKQILTRAYAKILHSIRFDETGNRLVIVTKDTIDVVDIHNTDAPKVIFSLPNDKDFLQACLKRNYLAARSSNHVISLFNIDNTSDGCTYPNNETLASLDCFDAQGNYFVTFDGNNAYIYKKNNTQ